MWLFRDTNGLLYLTPVSEPPYYDEERDRWVVDDDRIPARTMEIEDDEIEFEVTVENSPVQVDLFEI